MGYDANGQQILRIDAKGNRTTYVYDATSQLTQRRYPNGTRTTWVYDPVGNPLTIAASAGTFTRTYDPLNQVHQLQWPTGEVLTWTYDAANQRRTRETSIGIVTYTFDANSQLVQLINEHEEVTSFSYDPAGREILKELANGTRASIVYNAAGQTLSVANLQENGEVISRFTYLYDPVGNRTSETREDGSHKLWTYDPTSQLISEEIADDVGTTRTTYTYDSLGNRLVLDVDGELTTSTYDAANRLIHAEEINGITTYTFDANGNQRSIETPSGDITTYSWSYENQLILIEEPDDVVTTQVYAPVNRKADELRITKETETGIVNFIWDDQNIIQEVDELNSVDAEYTLNPQPYGNLVSQHREDESTFYNYDALGSTQSLTDQAGTKTDEYTYSAFGKITSQSGSTENPFGWVGELGYYREQDGRIVIRQRDYTVEECRFRSEDPIRTIAGNKKLYRYAENNPANVVDPSGLVTPTEFWDSWSEAQRARWFREFALFHEDNIRRSAEKYCVPVELLAAVIANEMIDYNWHEAVGETVGGLGNSLGPAQLTVPVAIQYNLFPEIQKCNYKDTWFTSAEDQYINAIRAKLNKFASNIDAAANLMSQYLDILCGKMFKNSALGGLILPADVLYNIAGILPTSESKGIRDSLMQEVCSNRNCKNRVNQDVSPYLISIMSAMFNDTPTALDASNPNVAQHAQNAALLNGIDMILPPKKMVITMLAHSSTSESKLRKPAITVMIASCLITLVPCVLMIFTSEVNNYRINGRIEYLRSHNVKWRVPSKAGQSLRGHPWGPGDEAELTLRRTVIALLALAPVSIILSFFFSYIAFIKGLNGGPCIVYLFWTLIAVTTLSSLYVFARLGFLYFR